MAIATTARPTATRVPDARPGTPVAQGNFDH